MEILPKIFFSGAQTSKNLFLYELITQWYLNSIESEQLRFDASWEHCFLRASISYSFPDVGHILTALTSNVWWHSSLSFLVILNTELLISLCYPWSLNKITSHCSNYIVILLENKQQKQEVHGPYRSLERDHSINTFVHEMITPQRWLKKESDIIFFLKTYWS